MYWMAHSIDMLAVIDWAGMAIGLVMYLGFEQAMELMFSSKEEKLREAALNLQKKQIASQKGARTKLADRERGLQSREQAAKGIPDEVWSNLMRSVIGSSGVPGSAEDQTLEDQGVVRARDLTDQHHTMDVGDGDVEGILAAISSLQEKSVDSVESKGIYGRIMG